MYKQYRATVTKAGLISADDFLPTSSGPGHAGLGWAVHTEHLVRLAAAGQPDIKDKLLVGHVAGSKTYKVHIDGYNMLPYLKGEVKDSPRNFFFYISDDGDIMAIRVQDWKMVLMEQRAKQLATWIEPFVKLRIPKLFNLRRDPFERADENSNTYYDWMISRAYIMYLMQGVVGSQIENFVKFPPRQKPASFNLDAVMRDLEAARAD